MKSVLRKQGNTGFTIVTNKLLNGEMSLKAIGLYVFMYSKPDDWNFTLRSMASQLKDGIDSVRTGINELKEAGYIRYQKNSDGSGVYYIYTDPYFEYDQKLEIPTLEKPNIGKSKRINKTDLCNKTDFSNKTKKESNKKMAMRFAKDRKWLNKDLWEEWVDHRIALRKPLTEATVMRQLKFLYSHIATHDKIIEQSLLNGWTGLFILKTQQTTKAEYGSLAWQMEQEQKQEAEVVDVELLGHSDGF